MKDSVAHLRRKSRYVAEVKYDAVPQFFDKRGEILGELHPHIRDRFERWTTNHGQVLFLDRLERPTSEFVITHTKMALILEDSGPLPSFLDQVDKYWKLSFEFLEPWVRRYSRVGVRIIEILESPRHGRLDDVIALLLERLHRTPDLDLTYKDTLVKLVHEHGWWQVGPASQDEPWVTQVFKVPDENVPKVGFGLDIDSFATEVEVNGLKGATQAIRTVATLTKSVEEQVVAYLGLNG